jgi:conserved oligomeric Golgi complex subunit 4
VEQLFNQLMRPKLRTLISDVYKDVSYVLDDDAYSAAEYHDVVRKRFIRSWDSLVEVYKVRWHRVLQPLIQDPIGNFYRQ